MTEMMTIIIGLLIPLLGTMLGSAFVFFYERRNVHATAEVVVGLCLRRNGGSVRVIIAHSRYGDEGR